MTWHWGDSPTDCRRFKQHHACYVDDTLPGATMERLSAHRAVCESCAAHDTRVRRALMIVRSTPSVQPSARFRERLASRLRTERAAPRTRARHGRDTPERVFSAILAAAAAAILIVGNGAGFAVARTASTAPDVVHAPVVVTRAEPAADPVAVDEMFATVSWSLPVYQAMLLAQRATEYFAESHARTLSASAGLNPSY